MREPMSEKPHNMGNGVQKLYRFPNGYGASVVRFEYSYGADQGLWELAVIHYPKADSDDFSLTYGTPITDDVIGYLSETEVDELLTKIEAL